MPDGASSPICEATQSALSLKPGQTMSAVCRREEIRMNVVAERRLAVSRAQPNANPGANPNLNVHPNLSENPNPRSKPLREAMPEVAGFIDALRDAFGRDSIDPALSQGLAGEPTFYAVEGGHAVGTPISSDTGTAWRAVGIRDRYYCNGCDGRCAGTEARCSVAAPLEHDVRAGFDTGF
jgi:hypothetical protein